MEREIGGGANEHDCQASQDKRSESTRAMREGPGTMGHASNVRCWSP
jgi:hypothetical protein